MEGTIKTLTDKGFGFISIEGEEKDLFFHSNELRGVRYDELKEGDKVSFEKADSPKGPNAINVSRESGEVSSETADSPKDDVAKDSQV